MTDDHDNGLGWAGLGCNHGRRRESPELYGTLGDSYELYETPGDGTKKPPGKGQLEGARRQKQSALVVGGAEAPRMG